MGRDLAGLGGEWRMRARDGGVEKVGGDGVETGSVTKEKGKLDEWYRCQPHRGLQGYRGEQQQIVLQCCCHRANKRRRLVHPTLL